MLWLLEADVFAAGPHPLRQAAVNAGHRVRTWDDAWWDAGLPALEGSIVFHGSLGNASRIASQTRWSPGAYCDTAAFHCSQWYPRARTWLLQEDVIFSTVRQLVAAPQDVTSALGRETTEIFVRPDSPLKPFSGRVVKLEGLTAATLDHGYYYEDLELPIVVSGTRAIEAEWRFVVCDRVVVTGCQYQAEGRAAKGVEVDNHALQLAHEIAAGFDAPDPIYVLDVVRSDGQYRMVEINPFSGADLYACDHERIVASISGLLDP